MDFDFHYDVVYIATWWLVVNPGSAAHACQYVDNAS